MANANNQAIFVNIGDNVIELTGEDLTAFKAQRKLDADEANAIKLQMEARVAARESALAKLADLGLTAEEIAAL